MTFKEYIIHQLKEMRREVLTATEDLSEEDLVSFEPVGHWPVAWIVEHCTDVVDSQLYSAVHGSTMHSYASHVKNWFKKEPVPGEAYPDLTEMNRRWTEVCDAVISDVEAASDAEIQENHAGSSPFIDNILLAINHTNSHLRSLWCILGQRRVDSKWAVQQDHLA